MSFLFEKSLRKLPKAGKRAVFQVRYLVCEPLMLEAPDKNKSEALFQTSEMPTKASQMRPLFQIMCCLLRYLLLAKFKILFFFRESMILECIATIYLQKNNIHDGGQRLVQCNVFNT